MKIARLLVVFAPLCLSPLGCSSTHPHDNFKNHHARNVGMRADDPRGDAVLYARWFRGEAILDNGNIEKSYQYRGSCVYFYEIDRKTNIIVGWRFEGSKADCIIVP